MIVEGEDAIFSVVATGAGTVRYQWFVDNNAIIGETSDTLILNSVELSDSSTTYSVDVTDDNGIITSNTVTLTITEAPVVLTITDQPGDLTITVRPLHCQLQS